MSIGLVCIRAVLAVSCQGYGRCVLTRLRSDCLKSARVGFGYIITHLLYAMNDSVLIVNCYTSGSYKC